MKKTFLSLLMVIGVLAFVLDSCTDPPKPKNNNTSSNTGTVTDRDGNTYATIKIGNQNWMSENLRANATAGTTYCYGNKADSCVKAGRLYDTTAMKSNPCPNNWHVPTDDEWMTLEKYIGMSTTDVVKTNDRAYVQGIGLLLMKDKTGNVGFNSIFTGIHVTDNGFENAGSYVGYWTSTKYVDGTGSRYWMRSLSDGDGGIYRNPFPVSIYPGTSMCIRCIQNQ